ncbi:MAG: S8 family serine peptidase, partial [Eggerthellaceae bacterium]|nr:S8 family serine peptidase [Eggerthellaceae bacterium]
MKRGAIAGVVLAACAGVALAFVLGVPGSQRPSEVLVGPVNDVSQAYVNPSGGYELQDPAPGDAGDAGEVGTEAVASPAAATVGPDDIYVPNQLLLLLEESDTIQSAEAFLADLDVSATKRVTNEDVALGFVVLELAEGVDVLTAQTAVEEAGRSCQPNYVYHLMDDGLAAQDVSAQIAAGAASSEGASGDGGLVPLSASSPLADAYVINDNYYTKTNDIERGYLWGVDSVNAREAWNIVRCLDADQEPSSNTVTIATLDTGCDVNHEDLKDRVVFAYDAVHQTSTNVTSVSGHGTHVAGIAAATANNAKGVAGYSYNANLLPITVFKQVGSGVTAYSNEIARAYSFVINNKDAYGSVRVINLSVGMVYTQEQIDRLDSGVMSSDKMLVARIKEAHDAGILTVSAAGNSTEATVPYVCYPGDLSETLNVMNLQYDQALGQVARSETSNYNTASQVQGTTNKKISAPGTRIASTWDASFPISGTTTSYALMDGTSMAAPCVSGIAALLFAYDPSLTPDEVEGILCASATDVVYTTYDDEGAVVEEAAEGWDPYTGYGEVNAYHALQLLKIQRGEADFQERSDATFKQMTTVDGSTHTYVTAEVGDSFTLALPFDGSYPFSWETSDASIATVDANGVVTAHASGSVTITARMGEPLAEDITCSIELKVTPLNINRAVIGYIENQVYAGSPICPGIVATAEQGGRSLVEGVDYVLTYANNENVGLATVSIQGKGECYGTTSRTFNIMHADIAQADISISSVAYTGKELTPKVTVTYGAKTLQEGTDYTLQYSNNVNPGTGSVRVKAVSGGNFTGVTTGTFSITQGSQSMHRLYNPNSGEHFYTASTSERDNLKRLGWR